MEEGVSGLVGLGPGLTPSGDDLLAGVLLALSVAGHGWPLVDSPASTLGKVVIGRAASGTNRVSAAMLGQAARGLGSEASHRLIQALLEEEHEDDKAIDAVRQLAAIGHTSGWDTLVGILLGLHLSLRLTRQPAGRWPLP